MSDVDLTKKGEAYVNAATAAPQTLLVPLTDRKAIAASIEQLIDMLDAMSPDPDLEDGADNEPSLGWTDRGPQATSNVFLDGRGSAYDDREEENEHGGDILDQPHDDNGDSEPWLGWGDPMAQNDVGVESVAGLEDTPDCCGVGKFNGDGADEARRMLRGRKRNEPSLTLVAPAIAVANWYGIPATDPDPSDRRARYWTAKGF
ncbi:hypothetical protein [Mesorhizobium jarvisii]|uniref:hypothetical protein n=1 Tax=Mesorhizobium jarvisii TaxID=1777867 RepID=UPI001F0B4502|nr:hypothetical protein [Mesorhizobium jarvisii]MCH4560329.1 hypothetical protein [Mesorhizobium jarvisii]